MKPMSLEESPAPRSLLTAATLVFIGGCATFSPDGGFSVVEEALQTRTGEQAKWVRSETDAGAVAAEVKRLLAAPLGASEAVRIALLNNRGLQAAYAELGIAEGDLVQAGRWINPTFSYARLRRGDELEIERSLLFNVLALLTMPRRVEIAEQRFAQVQLRAAAEAMQLTADTRRAWTEAVAAQESLRYFGQVQASAEAGATLAGRAAAIGNMPRLHHMREQVFYAEASAQFGRARVAAGAARERLTRLLGLEAADFRLPERLPDLPAAPRELGAAESAALQQRLDVLASKRETEALAATLGLTKATRFVDVLELSAIHKSEAPGLPQKGWEVELRLPIFDTGDARLAQAQHRYLQAVNRTAQVAVNARSEVREAYAAYGAAYELARHYRDEVVPLRKRISDENLLRYNGMLIGVFELLADARETTAAVNAAIGAAREYWLAESTLQMALTGRSPGSLGGGSAVTAISAGGAGAGEH